MDTDDLFELLEAIDSHELDYKATPRSYYDTLYDLLPKQIDDSTVNLDGKDVMPHIYYRLATRFLSH